MNNPFITIEDWLRRIEANQNELLQRLNNPAPTGPEVGGIELAQEVLRLSKARIYALVSQRAIPVAKRGNKLHFSRTALLDWVAAGNRKVTTSNGQNYGR